MPRIRPRKILGWTLVGACLVFAGCVTRPDAQETDPDSEKWYVKCRLHDTPWCLGPFRREKDAERAGFEHEFIYHMSQYTTRVTHEPCDPQ
ncbi:MAG: hypothetical protein U0573_08155 [Phycisphaerales bacterium]|nr:hypothetical protein [Planctomycetota bacterium]